MINHALAFALIAAAIFVAIVTDGRRREFAIAFVLAILAMRLFVGYLPHDLRYLASCALWVVIGKIAISRSLVVPGALLITSGLCYAIQAVTQWPPVAGNPALVLADVFGWLALLGVYYGGISGLRNRRGLGLGSARRGVVFSGGCGDLAKKEAP